MTTKTIGRVKVENNTVDTASNLGFKIGEKVKINRKFFLNHGEIPINLGLGIVMGKTQPTKSNLPKIIVQFSARKEFFEIEALKQLLYVQDGGGRLSSILLQIHPVYLEKVKQ